MADTVITKQDLIDASADAKTLTQVVNSDETTYVQARLGEIYPSLSKALYSVIQAGGFEPFQTEAALLASVPTVPKKAAKALDTKKVWIYEHRIGESVPSWHDTGLSEKELAVLELTDMHSKNLYDASKSVTGERVSGTGAIATVAGAKRTDYIKLSAGTNYTVSWSNTVTDSLLLSCFDQNKNLIAGSLQTLTATSPRSFKTHKDAVYVVLNLKHSATSAERENFQLEEGSEATKYEEYSETRRIKNELISYAFDVQKDYEIKLKSKNLFSDADVLSNYFLSTVTGGLSQSVGWTVSNFIPVEGGKTYTLSANYRARQGISFFASNVITNDAALLYDNSSALPLTVVAPMGAKYAVIALESNTSKGWSKLQFEEGSEATEYIQNGVESTKIKAEAIQGIESFIPVPEYKATLSLFSGSGSIKVGDFELGVKIFNALSYTVNPVFNFNNDKFKGTQIRTNGDDVAPVRMLNATIGANHGYAVTTATMNAHGKTNADVGSVWSDGTRQWVLTRIISVNNADFTCRTENRALIVGTLTHVSGALNTANYVVGAVTNKQWYPSVKGHKLQLIVDNKAITETTGEFGFDESIKVVESYDLSEKNATVEWLIANGGKEVTSYSAESALNVSNVHEFHIDGTDVISCNFFTHKAITAQDLMFTQSARLTPVVDGNVKYYVPRSIAFTHDSQSFDFSKPTIIDNLAITNRIDFTIDKTEPAQTVPDRLVMLNNSVGYAVGYLPVLDASSEIRNSLTSKGIQISQFESKVYPYLVDGLTTLNAGAHYSCVAYRKYFKRPADARRTVEYDIPSSFGNFLFLDWHVGNFIDVIDLPNYMKACQFEVVEKTDNVEILTKVSTGNLAVRIGVVTTNARLILKFK